MPPVIPAVRRNLHLLSINRPPEGRLRHKPTYEGRLRHTLKQSRHSAFYQPRMKFTFKCINHVWSITDINQPGNPMWYFTRGIPMDHNVFDTFTSTCMLTKNFRYNWRRREQMRQLNNILSRKITQQKIPEFRSIEPKLYAFPLVYISVHVYNITKYNEKMTKMAAVKKSCCGRFVVVVFDHGTIYSKDINPTCVDRQTQIRNSNQSYRQILTMFPGLRRRRGFVVRTDIMYLAISVQKFLESNLSNITVEV